MSSSAAWQDYLAAAQAVDAAQRARADTDAAATRSISTARAELAALRARLELQRHLLAIVAEHTGRRSPALVPADQERADARALVTGPDAVEPALHECRELVAAVDAQLARAMRQRQRWWRRPSWWRRRRR